MLTFILVSSMLMTGIAGDEGISRNTTSATNVTTGIFGGGGNSYNNVTTQTVDSLDNHYHKIGCVKNALNLELVDLGKILPSTIFNRSSRSSPGHELEQLIKMKADACNSKAKDKYKLFVVSILGHCLASKDLKKLRDYLFNQTQDHIGQCGYDPNTKDKYVYITNPMDKIPIDGGYASWSVWGPCDRTCGNGYTVRERTCTKPLPNVSGKDCSTLGSSTEYKQCKTKECPIDGKWVSWSPYTKCSVTCSSGTRTRTRQCIAPKYGGKQCKGQRTQTIECTRLACETELRHGFVCTGSTLSITCPVGWRIKLNSYFFGRDDNRNACSRWGLRYLYELNCYSNKAGYIIRGTCQDKQQCRVYASTNTFGHPCSSVTRQYLNASWRCQKYTKGMPTASHDHPDATVRSKRRPNKVSS